MRYYTFRVYGQDVDITREQAAALLRHAKARQTLSVCYRYRGEACYELGRTEALNHPAFVTVTVAF